MQTSLAQSHADGHASASRRKEEPMHSNQERSWP
jgi:hypothetical protein